MPPSGQQSATQLVPLMRYRDVGIASEWLCAAFGFEPHFAAKAPDGAVFYAELRLGDSMIMLGASGEPSPDDVMTETGPSTDTGEQSCYVVLSDVDSHYDQAKRAGATITLDLKSDDIGGRGYSCRDLEGHVWNFGTYDPWRGQANAPRAANRTKATARAIPGLNAAIAATLAVSVVSGWFIYGQVRGPGDGLTLQRLREALIGPDQSGTGLSTGGIGRTDEARDQQAAKVEASRAQRAMTALKEELEEERRAKAEAQAAAAQAQAATDRARATAEKAEAEAQSAQVTMQQAQAETDKAHAEVQRIARSETQQSEAARRAAERAQAALADAAKAEKSAAVLREDLARQQAVTGNPDAAGDVTQAKLQEAQAAKVAAEKAAAEAQAALAEETRTKESALRALADAGARIATLEVELKAAKTETVRTQLRARATSSVRDRSKLKTNSKAGSKQWPYSEW